ncbi:MAG: hypothetical protein BM556_13490 [Bacteriovorax sp. MedPE-SWde]|nr:MAG: hypothetical protein BM556_13490 [Bacteriovorax sp. MedPE-SWde]
MKEIKLQTISTFYLLQFGVAVAQFVAAGLTIAVMLEGPITLKLVIMAVFLNGQTLLMAYAIWKFNTSMTITDSKLEILRHFYGSTRKEDIQFQSIVGTRRGFWGLYLKLDNNSEYGPIMYLDDDENSFETDYLPQPVLRSKQVIANLKEFIDQKISER